MHYQDETRGEQMSSEQWFDEVPVLGRQSPQEVAAKLRELGEQEAADLLVESEAAEAAVFGIGDWFRGKPRAWQYTAHTFGYLPPLNPGTDPVAIQHAGNIEADRELQNTPLKLTLQGLRVADYPGSGDHRVLFDFYAQNQIAEKVEHLHFTSTYRAREGQRAAVVGYPIFLGLRTGPNGLAFRCFTVNVKNDEDEKFLQMLESDTLKAGLEVASTFVPAIGQLSSLAFAITKNLAQRNRNVPVQDFHLGLDFSSTAGGARLREGAYIAVQIPETTELIWDWEDWVFLPSAGEIVSKEDKKTLIPHNYVSIGVSRYEA